MIADRQPDLSPVVKRIIVRCSAEDAFQYFTRDFHKWWPAHTHSVTAMSSEGARRPRSCTMDPRPEGRIIEHGPEHEEYVWGTVLTWEPPRRVAFTWHPGQDERAAQIVEVTFSDVAGGTEVVLTHSGFDRLAEEQAALVREGYNNGWESVFTSAFREHVEQHA
jgi:uncharacterized protein YndB with AHSA1/START domain